jgi:hypothetical protein
MVDESFALRTLKRTLGLHEGELAAAEAEHGGEPLPFDYAVTATFALYRPGRICKCTDAPLFFFNVSIVVYLVRPQTP